MADLALQVRLRRNTEELTSMYLAWELQIIIQAYLTMTTTARLFYEARFGKIKAFMVTQVVVCMVALLFMHGVMRTLERILERPHPVFERKLAWFVFAGMLVVVTNIECYLPGGVCYM
jgi:hypothetical protein